MGILSLILIAGAIVLMFFVVLSGVTNSSPLNKTYFLQVDTSSIAGSGRAVSQWTYFYVCGAGNQGCGKPVPDLPFGYAWVGGSAGVPAELVGYVIHNFAGVETDKIQRPRQGHYKHLLLLSMALRLGFLPHWSFLQCLGILHGSSRSLQPSRIWALRNHPQLRPLLVLSRSFSDDVINPIPYH